MTDHFDFGLRIAALVTLGLWTILITLKEVHSAKKWIFLQFLLCLMAYILGYYPPVAKIEWLYHPLFFLSVALPFSFWMATKVFFNDDFEWKTRNLLWYALPLIQWLGYSFQKELTIALTFLGSIPYLISMIFMLMAIYESIRNQHNDLIDSRRRNRIIAVIYSSVMGIFSLYLYFTGDPNQLPLWASSILLIGTPLFCSLFLWPQLSYSPIFPISRKKHSAEISTDERIQHRILQKLDRQFVEDKGYVAEGITISRLAEQLQEKEYLLRKAINQGLGYRNFNDYLNQLRIEEAQRIMAAHRAKELTFQEIAYKLGYQSTATFNRAFKNCTGLTPTAYVKQL